MGEEIKDKPIDFCVPIDLNQPIVFDLLAILDDGFSQITSITKSQNDLNAKSSEMGASIGLNNVFSLIGVAFNTRDEGSKSSQSQEACTQQKIHTPTSLFSKLRQVLFAKNLIKEIHSLEDIDNLKSGEFVEFKAILRKNPLVEIFEMMTQLFGLVSSFSSQEDSTHQKKNSAKPLRSMPDPNEKIRIQLDLILKDLHQSNSLEILGELLEVNDVKAVLSTKIQYFNDSDSNDIVDGEFRVLGKVVRVIKPGSKDSINLLRKTSFGKMDSKILGTFPEVLSNMNAQGIKTPEFITEIEGPAFQIIPIAIFT